MQRASVLALVNAMVFVLAGCADGCRTDIVSRVESSEGTHNAVLFQRDCGATTGFSTQISVIPAGGEPTGAGNVFRADAGRDIAVHTGAWHGPWAEMRWHSPRHLLIRYAAGARLFAQASEADGIRISYEPVKAASPAPP